MWKLVPPRYVDRYSIRNSLAFSITREETIFGDDVTLNRSYEGGLKSGGDEYGAIPFGTKYIWAGGHINVTDDPAIRDLWLAYGFGVLTRRQLYPGLNLYPSQTLRPGSSWS
jgi:hypothetical protein